MISLVVPIGDLLRSEPPPIRPAIVAGIVLIGLLLIEFTRWIVVVLVGIWLVLLLLTVVMTFLLVHEGSIVFWRRADGYGRVWFHPAQPPYGTNAHHVMTSLPLTSIRDVVVWPVSDGDVQSDELRLLLNDNSVMGMVPADCEPMLTIDAIDYPDPEEPRFTGEVPSEMYRDQAAIRVWIGIVPPPLPAPDDRPRKKVRYTYI